MTEETTVLTEDCAVQADTGCSVKQKLILIVLLLAQLLSTSGFALLSPFFPQEAKAKGLKDTEIGLIFACFPFCMFITSPVYGSLITKLKPKFMCISGTFLCGGGCLLFGFLSYTDGVPFTVLCFMIRIVQGNGNALLMTASTSVIIQSFPGQTNKMASLIEMFSGFGYIVAPFAGAFLYELGGFILPFVVVGSLTVCLAFLLMITLPFIDEQESKTKNFFHLFKIPGLVVIFFSGFTSLMAVTYLDPIFSDWACKRFSITPAIVGFIYTGWAGAYALTSPIVGFISDKGYIYSPVLLGFFGSGITYLFMAPSPLLSFIYSEEKPIYGVMIFTNVMLGAVLSGVIVPVYQAAISHAVINGYKANLHLYGMISGMINSSFSLGSFVGLFVSGFFTEHFGFSWSTTIMALGLILMGLLWTIYLMTMKALRKPLAQEKSYSRENVVGTEREPLLSPHNSTMQAD